MAALSGCQATWPMVALAAIYLADQVFEWWLGRTNKVKAASKVELLLTGVMMLVILIFRKGERKMIEPKQVEYAKEIGDVGQALVVLVADVKAGKSVTEIMGDALPKLVAAVDGVDQVSAELKASRKAALATLGYHTGEIVDALLPQA